MHDVNEMIGNAARLSKVVDEVVAKLRVIQPGGSYLEPGEFRDGDTVLKVRLRLAPRLKVGAAVNLGTGPWVLRDGHSIAPAVAALLEMPVEYQMWKSGETPSGLLPTWTTGAWANSPVGGVARRAKEKG